MMGGLLPLKSSLEEGYIMRVVEALEARARLAGHATRATRVFSPLPFSAEATRSLKE